MATGLAARLSALGFLRGSAPPEQGLEGPTGLLRLCADGAVAGALSVALDVQPDELIGPLCAAIGGRARQLKVLDVRSGDGPELDVEWSGQAQTWRAEGLRALVDAANALFAPEPSAKAVAIVGEWEEFLVLWAIPKAKLGLLLREPFFRPENLASLLKAGAPPGAGG